VNIYSLSSLIAFLSCIFVGLFVYLKNRNNILNKSFALIFILAGAWTSFPFFVSIPEDDAVAVSIGRIIYLFASFVPTAFYYFILVLLNLQRDKKETSILKVLLFLSIVFSALLLNPNFI